MPKIPSSDHPIILTTKQKVTRKKPMITKTTRASRSNKTTNKTDEGGPSLKVGNKKRKANEEINLKANKNRL